MNIPHYSCDILEFCLAKSDVTFALIGIDRPENKFSKGTTNGASVTRTGWSVTRLFHLPWAYPDPIYRNATSGHIWSINVVEWEVSDETIRDVSAGEGILEAVIARALLDLAFQECFRVHLNEVWVKFKVSKMR
ncbi:hypothetical protein PENFLA_c023G08867 [Penicillium flavigenum]|uniref:Uncharacterized protein n=1 Tax=Penicillium flavigenum TaxID=254877 RepID=A0A1V6SV22_9EURO|nr:hypothetical protein PENFLA_c023G08867 [Penicillium flavigenum]